MTLFVYGLHSTSSLGIAVLLRASCHVRIHPPQAQRNRLGFPQPGDAYWTPDTIEAVSHHYAGKVSGWNGPEGIVPEPMAMDEYRYVPLLPTTLTDRLDPRCMTR